jgi:uracil-DNA glycosylase family 4
MPLIPNDDPRALAELLGYLGEIGYGELYLRPAAAGGEVAPGGAAAADGAVAAGGAGGAAGTPGAADVPGGSDAIGAAGKTDAAGARNRVGVVVPAAGSGLETAAEAVGALTAAARQAGDGAGAVRDGGEAAAEGDPAAREAALGALAEVVSGCRKCRLCEGRQKTVFGSGNPHADLMFIGEGPGAEEDRQGLPFVGRAGELLTRIIEAIGMTRDQVYIANIVKCRPPGNRDPQPDEVAACRSYLERQIALIRPRLIVALGRIAAQTLLGNDLPIGRMRGQWFQVMGVPVMVTYHPAALLRNPALKRPTWEDMQEVRDRLRAGG